jgi:hypothetical protein
MKSRTFVGIAVVAKYCVFSMPTALRALDRIWVSIPLPGYREANEMVTYFGLSANGLPRIERQLDQDLTWLTELPPVDESLGDDHPAAPRPHRPATSSELESLLEGTAAWTPTSFRTFVGSPEPRARVRSCTACYLDLAEIPVPVTTGGWLIHFLSDQQWTLHWLLYSGNDGDEAVVVSETPLGFREDPGSARQFLDAFDPSTGLAAVCAESFSEFLYRFWIENEIWFALASKNARRDLTAEELRYIEQYKRSGSR